MRVSEDLRGCLTVASLSQKLPFLSKSKGLFGQDLDRKSLPSVIVAVEFGASKFALDTQAPHPSSNSLLADPTVPPPPLWGWMGPNRPLNAVLHERGAPWMPKGQTDPFRLILRGLVGDGDFRVPDRRVYRFRTTKQRFSNALEQRRLRRWGSSPKHVHRYRTSSLEFFGGIPLYGSSIKPTIKR